jgi:hypothetical protein
MAWILKFNTRAETFCKKISVTARYSGCAIDHKVGLLGNMGAQILVSMLPGRLNFSGNIFSTQLLHFFFLHTKIFISNHVPGLKCQLTARFIIHSCTVDPHFRTCFMSYTWHLKFGGGFRNFRKFVDSCWAL